MSLRNAIERAAQNGHAEPMGLGFEVAEFPGIEEGQHLFFELGAWLSDRYPGRIASWRLQCTQFDRTKTQPKPGHEIVLQAEALVQTYADLFLESAETLFRELDGRAMLTAPKMPFEADGGNLLLEGWQIGSVILSLRERGGLLRLRMKLVTNREVWTAPNIRLDTNLSRFREDGVSVNIADVSNNHVLSGGLESGIAKVIAKTVAPNIDRALGATRWR